MNRVMFLILAGGRGERLQPLTNNVPKPLVRFKSSGAIIDFTLYNCLAYSAGHVQVLTQYQGTKISNYINAHWKSAFSSQGREITCLHGKGETTEKFRGTADAVYKALCRRKNRSQFVIVLASDHIYQMDYKRIFRFHEEHGGTATVGCVECARDQSHRFGIIKADNNGKIDQFYEKPSSLVGIVPANKKPLSSMGIYVFSTETLLNYLSHNQHTQSHDFGKDVLPRMALNGDAWAFRFMQEDGSSAYWRDVGTLSAYLEANLEQISEAEDITNFNPIPGILTFPIFKNHRIRCHKYGQRTIVNSKIADSARVNEATIESSVICPHVRVETGAIVKRSVVMDGAVIHPFAVVKDVIVGPNGQIRRDQINSGIFQPGFSSQLQAPR